MALSRKTIGALSAAAIILIFGVIGFLTRSIEKEIMSVTQPAAPLASNPAQAESREASLPDRGPRHLVAHFPAPKVKAKPDLSAQMPKEQNRPVEESSEERIYEIPLEGQNLLQ